MLYEVITWATWEHFNELDRRGLMMYGQMTAGSWIYIGSQGINIMQFTKEYNARTSGRMGQVIPAKITVFQDGSFTFILKTPPAAILLKEAAGIRNNFV